MIGSKQKSFQMLYHEQKIVNIFHTPYCFVICII